MTWLLLIYIAVLVLGGSALLWLIVQIPRRNGLGTAAFTVFLAAATLWTFAYAAELASASLDSKTLFAKVQYLGISTVPVAWFQFVWTYTGHTSLGRRRWLQLALLPALTTLLVWSNEWHHLIWTHTYLRQIDSIQVFDAEYGAWFWIHTAYSYGLLVAGLILLFRAFWSSPSLYQGQFTGLFLAAHVPLVFNALYLSNLPPLAGLDLTPLGFVVAGFALAWGLNRFRLLDLAPLAQRLVFETMGDGIVVLDAQQRIIDVNGATQRFLRQPVAALFGQPAAAVLADFGTAELWHPQAGPQRLEVETAILGGPAYVEVQSLPLETASQPSQGRLVILRDCTPYRSINAALEASVAQANHSVEAAHRHAQEVALLDQVRLAVARELDLTVVLRTVVEAVAATFGYTQVSLYLLQNDVLVLQHQVGYDSVITHVPVERGVIGRVVRSGEPVLLADVQADPTFLGAIDGIVSEVSVPLVDQGQVVGVLNVESVNAVKLNEDDLRLMQALSEHITIAMVRARLYNETQRAAQQLHTIISNVPMVLSATDSAGRITFSEGKGLAALGRKPGELVGQSMHTMYGAHPAFAMFEDALAGTDTHQVVELNDRVLDLHFTPMRAPDGAMSGVLGVALDITEQQRAEEERRALEQSMFEAQKLESLGMLAGGVAHDFNNLLQAILGNASLSMLEIPPDSPARTNIARIELAAQRAADLTRQILAYAGKGQFMLQWVDLSSIVTEMTLLLDASIPKHVTIQTHLNPALPLIEADGTQMRQVVMNLITNAAEALGSTNGVVTLTTGVRYPDRAVLARAPFAAEPAAGAYAYLEVSDTGCGMDAATQARIFEPFFSTKFAGRGLGLAAVFGIVRAHHGVLEVRSAPQHGTTFTVFLPVALSEDAVDQGNDQRGMFAAAAAASHQTVLVIEDEADVSAVITQMLQHLGCTVLVAHDGCAGIEQFCAHLDTISCVLLDLTMPRMTGEQTLAEIHNRCASMPVILMSGYTIEEVTTRLRGMSVQGFLQKPFTLRDVSALLEQVQHASTEQTL